MDDVRHRLQSDLAVATTHVADLEAGLAEIKAAAESSNADDEHDPEGTTIAFERQQLSALLDGARRNRAALRSALAELEVGRYGICAHCGREITPARLEARPQARSCIDCARAGRD
jgi:DnaK suppressor protein